MLAAAPQRVTALGAPWLVAAFATGALLGRPLRGAAGGAALLSAGTLAYYLVQVGVAGPGPAVGLADIALGWAIAAFVVGAAMGVLGALWRRARLTALTAAVPAAALAGEAVALAAVWHGRVAAALLLAELALAAVLLPLLAHRRVALLPAAAVAAGLAVVVAIGETELREAMRVVGWRGA